MAAVLARGGLCSPGGEEKCSAGVVAELVPGLLQMGSEKPQGSHAHRELSWELIFSLRMLDARTFPTVLLFPGFGLGFCLFVFKKA